MAQNEIIANLRQDLLAGLAGDGAAYGQFLNQLSPILRRVIGRKIPMKDVEDVLQEVLISIHKARHTYDGERPLMPWVLAIASFRMTDHLRKSYSQMQRQHVDIADYDNVLTAVTETSDDRESIEVMLKHVPQREKKILSLMHVEGYTAKQVGVQMGMKESAVKVAAHRAMKKIRETFGHG
ncbi:MAG: sigma-70 family RNA polymerase sigma factor [Alphaproteobacteria bacterium]|nr:sigma-70 family RNA polymerase sigma factor [Alphaproteobacteria bacterium]